MGRHKNPEILKFIEDLKKKGESFGFETSDEYKLLGGVYYIDLIWTPYKEKHNMFISFEIEKEHQRTLKNLDKIFETPASAVEKPYQHFIIMYDKKLSQGDKLIVEEQARHHNIQVFEDLKNNPKEIERLNLELEQLKIKIPSLIEKKGRVNPTETVLETILGLGKITPISIIENQLYPINQPTLTLSSQITEGKPLEKSPANVFDSKRYKKFAVIAIPREKYVLVIPGTNITLDVFLEQKKDGRSIYVTAEAHSFPFILDFVLKNEGGGTFDLRLDPAQTDVAQLKLFGDIRREMEHHKIIEVFYPNGKIKLKIEGIESNTPMPSVLWDNAVSDLAFIQEITGHRIPSPRDLKLTSKDFAAIEKLKTIITKGKLIVSFERLTFTTKKEVIQELLGLQKSSGAITQFRFELDQTSERLLDQEITLGPATIELPEMKFKDPLEEIQKRLARDESSLPVEVILSPQSTNEAEYIYKKWHK